jgi:hypothetical protein
MNKKDKEKTVKGSEQKVPSVKSTKLMEEDKTKALKSLTKKVKETKAKENFMDKDNDEDALKSWEENID